MDENFNDAWHFQTDCISMNVWMFVQLSNLDYFVAIAYLNTIKKIK